MGIDMDDKIRLAVVGCGNMGASIIRALSKKERYSIIAVDSNEKKLKMLSGEIENLETHLSAKEIENADIVLIAVKPQALDELYPILSELESEIFISIVAGIPMDSLSKNLGRIHKVARFMPNLAAECKKAVTAVCHTGNFLEEELSVVMDIASSIGSVYLIDEKMFNAFTGISGSGIAYALETMHYIALGGVKEGIPYPMALNIVRDTFESAAQLQRHLESEPMSIVTRITSAAGTTIEGIKALEEGGFGNTLMNAVEATSKRSKEIEEKYGR